MTKREMFETIATRNADNADIVAFCNHEIEMLDNKKGKGRSSKPTKTQRENAVLQDEIVAMMVEADKPMTATEITNSFDGKYTINKITSMLTLMRKANRVERVLEKKTPYYSIPSDVESDVDAE